MSSTTTERGPAGRFIVLEGPEGAGKSVQTERLAERLRALGYRCTVGREPGGTPLGEALRRHLWQDPQLEIDGLAELFLLSAARAALVNDVVRPGLGRGDVVLSDRFALSTQVYQGLARGLDREVIDRVTALATGGLEPDLTLILDVPVDVGRARQRAAGDEPDRIEREDERFMSRVRAGYRRAADEIAGARLIDASGTADSVAQAVWRAVCGRWPELERGASASYEAPRKM